MSLNKIPIYLRFSNYTDMLGKDVLIYVYAKDQDLANEQLNKIKFFCNKHYITTSKVYMDIGNSNKLDYKFNLKKLITENKNNNILISDISRLARDSFELFELKSLCHKNNINFYDVTSDNFVFSKYFETLEKLNQKIIGKGSDKDLQRNLNVLYVEPNKLPVKKTIKNTLEEKQKLVGGHIEYTYLENCNDVALICNEEHKILGLPINRDIGHDIIGGNFIIVGDDPELGEDRSLTEEQIEKYTKYFDKKSIEKTTKKYNEILDSSLDI